MIAGPISALILTGTGVAIGWQGGWTVMLVVGAVFAIFGTVFGYAAGSARVYSSSAWGVGVFVIDHTWSLLNTIIGAIFLTFAWPSNHLDRANSRHTGVVALASPIRGYARAIGTVEAGGGPIGTPDRVHEDTHVLQGRLLGPLYWPLVILGYVLLTIVPYWLVNHDHKALPVNSIWKYIENGVYPHMWNEIWADQVETRFVQQTRTRPVR